MEGDVVMIKSCYPISKKKHFTIEEIVERAPRYTPTHDEATPTPGTTPITPEPLQPTESITKSQ